MDAEVLQEILHRYLAIKRPEFIDPAFRLMFEVCDQVIPVDAATMMTAKAFVLQENSDISARDAVHLAVMHQHSIERIVSFDQDFDRYGVQRLS